MNTPEPEPKPKRSRRMIVWLVAAPIVVLLLALAGANWKTFHLAYCKYLIASDDGDKQTRGAWMVIETHLHEGMTLEEVRALIAPARVTETDIGWSPAEKTRYFEVTTAKDPRTELCLLAFDQDDRLLRGVITSLKPPGGI